MNRLLHTATTKVRQNPWMLLGALTVLFFWPLTVKGEVLFWGTPLLQFFPWRDLAVAEYLSGRLPLWNPYAGMGAPLAANIQSGVFYPPNAVYLILPIERAMTVTVLIHVFLAGAFTHRFARSLGRTQTGAFVAALAFMFSGYVIARAGFLSIVSAVAWLPAVMLGIEQALQAGPAGSILQRARGALGLACATAMLLLAGHVQLAYYILVFASSYLAWRSLARADARLLTIRRAMVPAGAIALGVALAAIQLAPAWELKRESVRQEGIDYVAATGYSLWPGQLLGVIAPNFLGSQVAGDWWGPGAYWEGVVYSGVLSLALAALAIRFQFNSTIGFFLLMGVVGLFLALGRYNPLFEPLFRSVPGLGLFQAPARFTLWYTFGLAMLAGAGWDALQAHPAASARSGALVVVCGVGLGIAAGVLVVSGGQPGTSLAVRSVLGGVAWLVAAGLLLAGRNRLPAGAWTIGALTLLYVDLFTFGAPLNPTTDARLYRRDAVARVSTGDQVLDRSFTTEATYRAAVDRYFSFRGPFITDWQALTEIRTAMTPDLATAERVFDVYNFDPIRMHRTTRLQETAEASSLPASLLNAMNVRYLPAFQPPDGAASWVPAGPPMVYRRDLSLPRAYVVQSTVRVSSLDEALTAMTAPGYDPAVTAIVESSIDFPPWDRGPRNARITEHTPQRVTVDVESSGGLLVLSDSYYPGWVARVDGRATPIFPTNAAFRGVPVPPGRVRVEFSYEPESVRLGMSITMAALAVTGVASGVLFLKRGRRS
ncbi:MAG: hypothetical protein EXR51_11460 [Dehalococcoidia bacterium]|nr:hypothetical protein [Dehalococcoidia bacterium]